MRSSSSLLPLLVAAVAAIALTACDSGPPDSALPPIPEADIDRFAPAIRRQLDAASAALSAKPRDADANGRMAMLLHAYELSAGAAALYERAALLDAREFRWRYLLGRVLAEQGANDRAVAELDRARELDPDYPSARIQLAQLHLAAGRLDSSKQLIDALLADDPERPEASFMAAQIAARQGRHAEAIARYEKVRTLSGDFAALHYGLAQAHRQLGDADAADRHTRLFELFSGTTGRIDDPILGEVHALDISATELINRARARSARGDNDGALKLLLKALDHHPDSLPAHLTVVGLYATRGQFDKADEHLDRARTVDASHPQLHYNTGIARLAENRSYEAMEAFRRAVDAEPGNADAHTQLALVLEARGKTDDALEHFRRAIAIEPLHRQANWLLGRSLMNAGDVTGAIVHLEKLRGLKDPSAPGILRDLARALERDRQIAEAETVWREAFDLAGRFGDDAVRVSARTALKRLEREAGSDGVSGGRT